MDGVVLTDNMQKPADDHPTDGGGFDNKAFAASLQDLRTTKDQNPDKPQIDSNHQRTQEEPVPEDLKCGVGSCKPSCLQVFNNPKAALLWLCVLSFFQGFMVNGINNVNTTTLERRYQLSSSEAGLISSSYDISAALLAIPVSYYGAHAHQPRMLSFAAFMFCCGAFVMTIPHFATPLYDLRDSQADACVLNANQTSICNEEQSNVDKWLGVFIIGMILNGVGGTILYSVGIVFIDSSVSSRSSPLYQGFLYASATLGPAVGYLLGGYFVESLYVDFDQVSMDDLSVSPDDPRFVGAWWVGFLVTGVFMFLIVFILVCYPRELPSTKRAREKRIIEVHDNGSNAVASQQDFGKSWRDLPISFVLLVKNPVYMFINLAGVCESLIVSAVATFMPKFIQNQFTLTAGFAAIVGGACAVPGAAGGQFAGGLISKLAKLNIKGMLRLNILASVAAAITCLVMLCRCDAPNFAGINQSYNSSLEFTDIELDAQCNAGCGCTTLSYEPICGIDNVQYFTPCHAGCKSKIVNGTKVYTDCTCITPPAADQDYSTMAAAGTCEISCQLYYVFLPFFFVVIFLVFLAAVPTLSVTLRCVPESQRSFAVGLQWVFIRFLGSIPGPILMGHVFDSTCTVWQDKCDRQGSCWLYDNALLSTRLMILTACIKLVSCVFFGLAYKFYKPPPSEPDASLTVSNNGTAFENVAHNGSISTASIPSLPEGYVHYVPDDDAINLKF